MEDLHEWMKLHALQRSRSSSYDLFPEASDELEGGDEKSPGLVNGGVETKWHMGL